MGDPIKSELVKIGSVNIEALRAQGSGWVVIRPLCESLRLDPSAQRKRISGAAWATAAVIAAVGSDGKPRDMQCLRSDCVAMFLATIEPRRIKDPAIRSALEQLQREAAQALDIWFRGAAAPAIVPAEPRLSGGDDADARMLAMMESAVHLHRQQIAQKVELQQLTAQQTELAAQQVALTSKTDQLDAKVTKLIDRPARVPVEAGNRPVTGVKVASELGITPRSFSLFLRARNSMRALQRPDGRWPLAETVAKYKELVKDASAQLALPTAVVPSAERKSLARHVRTYCAQLNYNSEQYGDTNNLIYDRFEIEEGYDPRDFITSRMSALDVVQVNGHIAQLFEIVRRLCPLPGDPRTGGGGQ